MYEQRVGSVKIGETSISSKIRRIYTNNYSALDRFDRFWYQIVYPFKHMNWRTYFAWCVLKQGLVNAHVAYMKYLNKKIPIRHFCESVIKEFVKESSNK